MVWCVVVMFATFVVGCRNTSLEQIQGTEWIRTTPNGDCVDVYFLRFQGETTGEYTHTTYCDKAYTRGKVADLNYTFDGDGGELHVSIPMDDSVEVATYRLKDITHLWVYDTAGVQRYLFVNSR